MCTPMCRLRHHQEEHRRIEELDAAQQLKELDGKELKSFTKKGFDTDEVP